MRRPVYVLGARPWWMDAVACALGVLPMLAAILVLLFFTGCGDDAVPVYGPCAVQPDSAASCSGAPLVDGYSVRACAVRVSKNPGVSADPVAGCVASVPDSAVPVLCVASCEVTP